MCFPNLLPDACLSKEVSCPLVSEALGSDRSMCALLGSAPDLLRECSSQGGEGPGFAFQAGPPEDDDSQTS